jgi:hypothetical protein
LIYKIDAVSKSKLNAGERFSYPCGYIPFGGQIQEEHSIGGYAIPSKVSVGWRLGADLYFKFYRAQIEDAAFQ